MSICNFDGLQPNTPYAACYRLPHGNLLVPNWKYDPHRKHFCQKFGHFAPHICYEVNDPCQTVHQSLQSLDEFSTPPLYRKGGCAPKFRYKNYKNGDGSTICKFGSSRTSCDGIPQLPKYYCPYPKPYGDTICGICAKNDELRLKFPKCEEDTKVEPIENDPKGSVPDLPFVIYPMWTCESESQKKSGHKRTGVSKCIHPSSFRSLNTVSRLEYLNFFKLKSAQQLSLYQSKLAVDNRRPSICIPPNTQSDELDLTKPISVNAKLLKMCQRGKRKTQEPTVSVCIPGPISIG